MGDVRLAVRRCLAAAAAAGLGLIGVTMPATPAAAKVGNQWHLKSLRIDEVHRISTGKGVVVAVVDSGVAPHPDLDARVIGGIRYPEDTDGGRTDAEGHGTPVAGVIAARGGRNRALGIAPDARILSLADQRGEFAPIHLHKEIRWAVDHGARVINLSISVGKDVAAVVDAVRYALERDVVLVAAAGNRDVQQELRMPATIPGVLTVAGVDRRGSSWKMSVTGPTVGISAPSVDIATISATDPTGYDVIDGTSIATPIVAGAAALIRARYPQMKAPDVVNRLISTAVDAGEPGRDEKYGYGRLDILRALTADVPSVAENPLGAPPAPRNRMAAEDDSSDADRWLLTLLLIVAAVGTATVVLTTIIVLLVLRRRRRGSRPAPATGPPT